MTITELLEACEPTYRIEYRDREPRGKWTPWRSPVGIFYLNDPSNPAPDTVKHASGLSLRQAEQRSKHIVTVVGRDRIAEGRFEFATRLVPEGVWWPYPGAPEPGILDYAVVPLP